MRFLTKILLLFFLIILVCENNSAQENECAFTLKQVEKLYQQGNIETIPAMLSSCINNGFTKEERLEAYKLIIMSYLFNDDIHKADSAMLAFLKKYPDYKLNPTDTKKFINLYNSYRTNPIFSFGLIGGGNFTTNYIKEHISTTDLNSEIPEYYSVMGFQIGIRFMKMITHKTDLTADILFSQNGLYKEQTEHFLNNSPVIKYQENRVNIYIPISICYNFNISNEKLKPYVRSGLGLSYMFIVSAYAERLESNGNDLTSNNLDIMESYRPVNLWLNVGGGVSMKFLRGYMFLEISYNQSFIQQLSGEMEKELAYVYQIVPDRLVQGIFNFSAGYVYSVYKPKKLK